MPRAPSPRPTRRWRGSASSRNATNYVPAELRLTVWDGRNEEGRERMLATTGFHGGPINWLEPV